jgi:HECT-domain (ubiquitin-transferase)
MKKARNVLKNDSSEEEFDNPLYYGSEYPGQYLPALEKFFLSVDSGDEMEIAQSLAILSSELSMAEEQVLATQPLDKALSLLLSCLNSQNSEILLSSMTCITLIIDTLPELSEVIVHCRGIKLICDKLNNFGFIDLSEQAVRALEKISLEFPLDTLEARAIETVVVLMDYFDTEIQKKILNIICNSVRALESIEMIDKRVLPQIPNILGLLQNRRNNEFRVEKILDFFTIFIENLIMILPHKGDSFKSYAKTLIEYGLVRTLLDFFPSHNDLVLRLLYNLCDRSALAVKNFLSIGGFDVIKEGLLTSQSSKKYVFTEILDLLDSLIPRIPANEPWNKEKIEFYNSHPEYIQSFSELILPRTISIYENFLSKEDKVIMISILEKLLKVANIELISHYLTCQSFSTFISEIMISKDISTVRAALRISLILYEKIPQKIALNFSREGVIARISALKDPDRIKEFKKLPDKKFGGNLEELLLKAGDTKNPYQIESMLNNIKFKLLKPASLEDYKKEIINYSKKILEKHKLHDNKKAPRIGKEIKMISQKLSNCFGESALDLLIKIAGLLNSSERLSYYEISNSSIAESLWKWLAESSTDKLLVRLQEFIKLFTRDSLHGESFLSILIKYMIGTANFVHHFRIMLHDSKTFSHKKNHKVKILLEYNGLHPDENLLQNPDFRLRHNLFLVHNKVKIQTHQLFSFDKIKDLILKISNENDLYILTHQKIINETTSLMFLDRPYARNIQISISNGTKELPRGTTVLNLINKKSQLQLKFRIVKRKSSDLVCKYLKSPREILENLIQESSQNGLETKEKSYMYFRLVKFLYQISEYLPYLNYLTGLPNLPSLSLSTFNCSKLSALLSRQFQDPVSVEGNVPAQWVKHFPVKSKFLFHPQSRSEYLENFGYYNIYKTDKKNKVTVRRHEVLEDAMKILENISINLETSLEVEYQDEVGTGLGPTVEFYCLVSNEIKKLKIWRNSCNFSGLFPAPLTECDPKWQEYFEFIGKFIGKAIIDGRNIDFVFSPALWKLIFMHPLNLIDVSSIDKSIGKAFIDMQLNPQGIEKSELTFSLPGYYNIELKPNGDKILVNSENIEEYINLAASVSLKQDAQAKALRRGLEMMMPVDALSVLHYTEIESLLCGDGSVVWDIETLKQNIIPAHGYSLNSRTFANLLTLLTQLTADEQKMFLEFATGYPRLPLGGFEKLTPKLSVVKKDVQDEPDMCLPSVMTCQHYLKLPDYSSFEILKSKLLFAVQEGRQAFHLS